MSPLKPLVFGHIDGYPVGSLFRDRCTLSSARVHGPPMAGIWGRQAEGACSIVMSRGYEDDVDELGYVMFPGHGGQDRPGEIQVYKKAYFPLLSYT